MKRITGCNGNCGDTPLYDCPTKCKNFYIKNVDESDKNYSWQEIVIAIDNIFKIMYPRFYEIYKDVSYFEEVFNNNLHMAIEKILVYCYINNISKHNEDVKIILNGLKQLEIFGMIKG